VFVLVKEEGGLEKQWIKCLDDLQT